MDNFHDVACSKCGKVVGRERGGKLKIEVRSRLVAISKSGGVEINCPNCKATVDLPLIYVGVKRGE